MNKQEWLHNVVMGGIFLGMSNVYGLVTSDIDDTRKLKVTLSAKDTNRITIDNSRIAQVFGIEELMAIQFDEENGQCFVKAKTNPGHPVTLTLITEEGETQDLEITFADQSSEVVRLHSIKKDLQPLSEVMGDKEISLHTQAVELMKQMVRGQPPKGLRAMHLSDQPEVSLSNGVTLQMTQRLQGGGFEAIMGTLRNPSDTRQVLKESWIAGEQDLAIYLSQRDLHPGQSAAYMIIRKRGEG
jgi:type-F conjugative transfer system secretin TraK